MKKIVSLLLALSIFLPTVARAETAVVIPSVQAPADEPDVGNAISPMRKGQKAPFTGVLLSPSATATVVTEISTFDERIRIEVDKALKICAAECDYENAELKTQCDADKKVLSASLEENAKRIRILDTEIRRLESEKTNPYLWTGVGVVGGTAMTLLTIFAINQVTK